jgi:hypothetical protein
MRTDGCEPESTALKTGSGTAGWMCLVGTVLCLLGTVPVSVSAQYAGAEEDLELRFHAPDVEGLSLELTGPTGTEAATSTCALPCPVTLMPGEYTVRARRSGLARSTRQRLEVTESLTYRVEYHSRRGWRIFGGVFLAAMTIMGMGAIIVAERSESSVISDFGRNIGIGVLAGGIAVGAPTLALPDRVRFVPEP